MSKVAKKAVGAKKGAVKVTLSTKTFFRTNIKAGCASAAPPLGPLLGKFGLNISTFCKDFNEKTQKYKKGVPLPITVRINPNRSWNIDLHTPSITFYLLQAAGIEQPRVKGEEVIGQVTLKHIYEIAKIKHEDPYSTYQIKELEEVVKDIVGLTKRVGLEIVKEIDPVQYGEFLVQRNAFVEKLKAEEAEKLRLKLQKA